MKKIAVVVCALAVAGSAVLVLQDLDAVERDPSPAAEQASPVALVPPAGETEGVERESPSATSDEPAPRSRVAVAASEAGAEESIRGRVAWPDALGGPDETAEVFALESAAGYTAFVRLMDGGQPGILARATVAADGGFELHPGRDSGTVHLMVRGRHVYLENTVELELGGAPSVVLAPACGAWIHGRVLSPPGTDTASVAGLRVQLSADETFGNGQLGRARFEDVVAADGRFELRGVVPRPSATLFVPQGKWAAHLVDLDGSAACTERELDVQLAVGGGLAGRVLDETGVGVPRAELRAIVRGQYFGFDDRQVGTAVADENGHFELAGLPPGEVFVVASARGYLESGKAEVAIVDRERTAGFTVELSRGSAIAGRAVFDDGRPAADTPVSIEFDRSFQVGMSAFNALRGAGGAGRTDADGYFRIVGLGSGPFLVEATATRGDEVFRARAEAVAPDTEDLELRLRAPLELTGTVTTPDGAPVPAFDVRAVRVTDGAVGPTATHTRTASGSRGEFELDDLIAGTWRVEVSGPDFARSAPREVELPGGAPPAFVVAPPASVQGVVVDPAGAPVADATVTVDTGESSWAALFADASEKPEATTDDRGRFHLTGIREGQVDLRASREGFAASPAVGVELAAGEDRAGLELVLSLGGRITGLIYDEGEPAAGRVISLVQWERGKFNTTMTESDERGEFGFENVEPGSWTIVAMDLGADWAAKDDDTSAAQRMASMKSAQVRVTEGSEQHVVLGAPRAREIVVRGRVTRGGQPYAGAMISADPISGEALGERNMTGIDARGEYTLRVEGPGQYQIAVNRMGRSAGEISVLTSLHEVPDEPEVVLDLEIPGGGIAGRVVDPDGRPLPAVGLTLLPGRTATVDQIFESRFASTTTDADGRFEVPDLRPGSYRLSTSSSGAHAGVVVDDLDVELDTWRRDVELVLPLAGAARVRVVDRYGRPRAGLSIFARDASGAIVHPISQVRTGGDGVALYEGLAPGAYRFSARDAELASERSVAATVASGTEVAVEIAVDLGGWLLLTARTDAEHAPASFQVIDADGTEVANLFTSMLDAQERSRGTLSGSQTVGPLAPGEYRVTALTPTGERKSRSVTVESGEERKLTLRL